jgi:hypothetical protein
MTLGDLEVKVESTGFDERQNRKFTTVVSRPSTNARYKEEQNTDASWREVVSDALTSLSASLSLDYGQPDKTTEAAKRLGGWEVISRSQQALEVYDDEDREDE